MYLFSRILALFAAHPYQELGESEDFVDVDLAAHLTNTSQHDAEQNSEPYVKLLDELVGDTVLSASNNPPGSKKIFMDKHKQEVINQMKSILSETFKAALSNPVHFMVTFFISSKRVANTPLAFTKCIRTIWCRFPHDPRRE